MKIDYVSLPYIYPLCPLNLNHAKMFVIADVFARYIKSTHNKEDVLIFPIASHFSGNTAQLTAERIKEYFNGIINDENKKTIALYKDFYGIPLNIVKTFSDADTIMKYFHYETIWELKQLGVSCDYKSAYTTRTAAFSSFVRCVIKQYENNGLLVVNKNGDLAVNYDEINWRENTLNLIKETLILKPFQKKAILSAFNNLSSGWELLRSTGYGVSYGNGLIIDPMFDSEMFSIYDLYVYWCNKLKIEIIDTDDFFIALFTALKSDSLDASLFKPNEIDLAQKILDSLPCNIFFGEEHLKNWLGKKFFAEQLMLHPRLRTEKYRILGMGQLDGKRMSASRGHAILSRHLIKDYNGTIARLVILLSGGNISKSYNYDRMLPQIAIKMLNSFSDYWVYLHSVSDSIPITSDDSEYEYLYDLVDSYITDGYLSRAVTELLVNVPAKFKTVSPNQASKLIAFYNKYLDIFLPEV